MSSAVPLVRSYWGLIRQAAAGRTALELMAREPTAREVAASEGVLLMTGMLKGDCPTMTIDIVGQPLADPDVAALRSATLMGVVTLAQTVKVAVGAGLQRIGIALDPKLGLVAGEPVVLVPTKALPGYAVHDAVVVSPTLLSVGLSVPALAIGQGYSLPAKLIRLNL